LKQLVCRKEESLKHVLQQTFDHVHVRTSDQQNQDLLALRHEEQEPCW